MQLKASYLEPLYRILKQLTIQVERKESVLALEAGGKSFTFQISTLPSPDDSKKKAAELPLDQIVRQPEKVAALLQSKLGLNQRIFARNCEVRIVSKVVATSFLNRYHLLNATQSAWNYGLHYHNELLAVASFSKGRKMQRLPENLRSYELIRFCTKAGITVTGGLSRLLKFFINEKHPGDIMTYVDAQWSDGSTFVKAGFKIFEGQTPKLFLVNQGNFNRRLHKKGEPVPENHYLSQDAGNIKLIYHVGRKL